MAMELNSNTRTTVCGISKSDISRARLVLLLLVCIGGCALILFMFNDRLVPIFGTEYFAPTQGKAGNLGTSHQASSNVTPDKLCACASTPGHSGSEIKIRPTSGCASGKCKETHDAPKQATIAKASDVPCTFALLREYQKLYAYFPGDGRWYLEEKPYYYQPSVCKFKFPRMRQQDVAECILDANVTSVMSIGDSNALKNFEYLQKYVTRCKNVRSERLLENGFVPDPNYYTRDRPLDSPTEWSRYLATHYRHCGGCAGIQGACVVTAPGGKDEKLVKFEHMAMTLVLDDQLRLKFASYSESARAIKEVWALTTQEVYFRYFLKDRYPDVFLVFLPFNHMHYQADERMRLDIDYFASLLRLYFPKTTKVIFFPAFGEFVPSTAKLSTDEIEKQNEIRSNVIDRMNRAMYSVLSKYFLDPASNIFGFFDMVNVSRPVAGWSVDGQHMQNDWYQAATSMFWETFCNSVKYKAF